jgi:cytochrome P450
MESLKVLGVGVVPALIRGLFSPRKRAMKLLTALDADGRAVSALAALRSRYGGEGVQILRGRIVVLWGVPAIKEVLDRSAETYAADGGAKGKGMSHFQPDAVTLSRGAQWRDRRDFNEAVLASSQRMHPFAGRFLTVVDEEVDRMRIGESLRWEQFERLFDRITLRIVFGDEARCEQRLTGLLEKLMRQANRLAGLQHTDDYYEFYGEIERLLRQPGDGALVARIPEAPQTHNTRVVQQIPHWLFAMRDTLAANVVRALAAIVADPSVQRRVRQELEATDLLDPPSLNRLRFLEGCFQETMRLWPTTPLLARETVCATELSGEQLGAGTQVMLLNVFNHRDPEHVEAADRLAPDRWLADGHDYRFNHLSNGSQDCPGMPLVLLLGKAVIGRLLTEYSLVLEHPKLEPDEPLPHMLNFFETRFSAEPRGRP